MRDAVLLNGIPQGGLDVVLIEDVVERLGPVFSRMT